MDLKKLSEIKIKQKMQITEMSIFPLYFLGNPLYNVKAVVPCLNGSNFAIIYHILFLWWSVEVADQPERPEQKGFVRAVHGPGCQVIQPVEGEPERSKFIWLMDCDYKGMLPTSVIEIAMPSAQLQMIDCINNID